MQYYLMTVAATVLIAADFVIANYYQRAQGVSPRAGLRYYAASGLLTALIFWAASGFTLTLAPYSVLLAFGVALVTTAYGFIGFRIMREGSMVLYTLFLMTGGMVLPYLFGLAFLEETLNIWRVLGLIMIFAAAMLTNGSVQKPTKRQLLLCVVVFALNGFSSIFSKLHQIDTAYETVDVTAFVMLTGAAKCVLNVLILVFLPKEKAPVPMRRKTLLGLSAGTAAVSGMSYVLQLHGASHLPATVIYPVITGGTIVFSALAGWVCFREKPGKNQIRSILLCVIGTCMFL